MIVRIAVIAVVLVAVSSCDFLDTSDAQNKATITRRLYDLQIALENYEADSPAPASTTDDNGHAVDTSSDDHSSGHATSGTTASIVAVVDSLLLVPAAEGEEIDPVKKDAAMHRERLVSQAVNASLVKNKLINMIRPTTDERDRIRQIIITTNGSAMAPGDAKTAGEAIGVDHLIWAIIEKEGKDVNIVAQRVDNGVVVYDETLTEWDILEVPEEQAEE